MPVRSQSRPPNRGERERADREVQEVIDAASVAPPEFAADALLLLIESGRVGDPEQRRELLDQAFQLAGYAQEDGPLSWYGAGPLSAAFHALAGARIDRVSLRVRVARALLTNDPKAALELYEQIELPLDAKSECEQPFTYNLAEYYAALAPLYKSITIPAEKEQFLLRRFATFRSSAQVEPFAAALLTLVSEPKSEPPALIYPFGGRLSKLDQDSRVFTYEFRYAIQTLKKLALASPAGPREYLVQQARAWVLQASRHGLCAQRPMQSMSMDGTISRQEPVAPAQLFNDELAPLIAAKPVIDIQNAGTEPPGPTFKRDSYSAEYLKFDQTRRLIGKAEAAEKEAAQWKTDIENYVTLITDWRNPSADYSDPAPYYLEKAELLRNALGIEQEPPPAKPPDKEHWSEYWQSRSKGARANYLGRDRILIALVDLFESSLAGSVYGKRRCVWFAPVRTLVRSPENSASLDDLLIGARHPVLHLYGLVARLQSAAGRKYW